MIKCDMGRVEMSGTIEWLPSELVCINEAMIDVAKNNGAEEKDSYKMVRWAAEEAIRGETEPDELSEEVQEGNLEAGRPAEGGAP